MSAGVYKICTACKDQLRCPHPWWFSMSRRGAARIRVSLDQLLGRHVESKTEAATYARNFRTEIAKGAEANLTALQRQILKLPIPLVPVLQQLTLGNLLDAYEERHLANLAGSDRLAYKVGAIKRTPVVRPDGIAAPFGEWLVLDVSADALDRLREARSVRTVHQVGRHRNVSGGAATADKDLRLLRAAFNWALDKGIVERSPFRRGDRTTVKLTAGQPRSRRLQDTEGERLLAASGPHLRALVEAALETGCRLGELLSLQVDQVQFEPRAEVWLPAAKTKTGKPRRVPMSGRLQAVMQMRLAQLRETTGLDANEPTPKGLYVFGNEIGQRVLGIKTAWRLACQRAKIEGLHFHDLRREAGSRWMDGGVPLVTIQRWLGHTNISQTSTYLATTVHSEHDAMRRFEERRLTPIDSGRKPSQRKRAPQGKRTTDETSKSTVKH
jgi:integrase